jgi:hypothetical protein
MHVIVIGYRISFNRGGFNVCTAGGLQQIRASSSSAGRPSRVPDEALPAPFYKQVEQVGGDDM